MDNNKLNEIIKTYVASPNYEGAIMVTAEWGAGKSFYLKMNWYHFWKKMM